MSFWSTLGRIALGAGGAALAPLTGGASLAATLEAAGIGGGITAASSLFGKSKGGSTPSNTDINSLIQDISSQSKQSRESGRSALDQGFKTMDPGLKYLAGLLSGDRGQLTAATAPEAKTILDQYDSARKAVSELGPRGGNKGQEISESYFKQADAMTRLLETIRPGAAKELAGLGLDISKLGLEELQLGEDDLTRILDALSGIRGQNLQSYGALGQGIGNIIAALIGKMGSTGGSAKSGGNETFSF